MMQDETCIYILPYGDLSISEKILLNFLKILYCFCWCIVGLEVDIQGR